MAKEFKATIFLDRQIFIEETSVGIRRKTKPTKMRADIHVFKNKDDEWQGSLEMFRNDNEDRFLWLIDDHSLDDFYMDCWIGFEGINAVDYDGTSGYLPNEVLDLIDKNGFNTDDIRADY